MKGAGATAFTFLLLGSSTLAGCRQDMAWQPKLMANGRTTAFADGSANRPPVEGTIERSATMAPRPKVDAALLARGRERFGIYCAPCHGPAGDGDGRVVERGFPRPPSYHDERLVTASAEHFYDVITNGHGVMYSYGARVAPADRWAIIAYIRALQLSQGAKLGNAAKPPANGGSAAP